MDFTVGICTRDRALQLDVALRSISAMCVPDDVTWEVLVIDNGSSDNTADVIASFAAALPIVGVYEPRAGKSYAYNTGIAKARGAYVAWTDDDVMVDVDWLAAYISAVHSHPNACVFGGPVVPVLQPPTPAWFASSLSDLSFMLAVRDFGPVERLLGTAHDCIPYGANFAVRMSDQRRYPYDPNLGVAPGRRRGGEETAVFKEMLSDGLEGWWIPQAIVRHIIPRARQTQSYIVQFYEGMGEAWAYSLAPNPRIFPVPPLTVLKVILAFVRLRVAVALRMRARVRYQTSLSFHYGALKLFIRYHLDFLQRSRREWF